MEIRADNKPMTVRDLLVSLDRELRKKRLKGTEAVDKYLDQPVILSSDEEGNDMLSLYGIEINKARITLWPAHFGNDAEKEALDA